jgi:hypothetical protein
VDVCKTRAQVACICGKGSHSDGTLLLTESPCRGHLARSLAHFMPPLKQLLETPPISDEWKLLRGKAMECITLMGTAVKPEIFREDIPDVVAAMREIIGTLTEHDIERQCVLIRFCYSYRSGERRRETGRVCYVRPLADFSPFYCHLHTGPLYAQLSAHCRLASLPTNLHPQAQMR